MKQIIEAPFDLRPKYFIGTAAEEKPTQGIDPGSRFYEVDIINQTVKEYIFDGNGNWVLIVNPATKDDPLPITGDVTATIPAGSIANAATVTPSDTTDLDAPSKWLYIGVSGDLEVILTGGQTVIFRNLAVGFYPICATRIKAAGTTALNIIAGW